MVASFESLGENGGECRRQRNRKDLMFRACNFGCGIFETDSDVRRHLHFLRREIF